MESTERNAGTLEKRMMQQRHRQRKRIMQAARIPGCRRSLG